MTEQEMAVKILELISSPHLNVPANEVGIMNACQEWMRSHIGEENGEQEEQASA